MPVCHQDSGQTILLRLPLLDLVWLPTMHFLGVGMPDLNAFLNLSIIYAVEAIQMGLLGLCQRVLSNSSLLDFPTCLQKEKC